MRDESQNEGGKRDDRTFNDGIRDNISLRTGFSLFDSWDAGYSEEANFT